MYLVRSFLDLPYYNREAFWSCLFLLIDFYLCDRPEEMFGRELNLRTIWFLWIFVMCSTWGSVCSCVDGWRKRILVACSTLERVRWGVRPWEVFNHLFDLWKNLAVWLDLSVLQRVRGLTFKGFSLVVVFQDSVACSGKKKKKMVPFPPSLPCHDLKGNLKLFV